MRRLVLTALAAFGCGSATPAADPAPVDDLDEPKWSDSSPRDESAPGLPRQNAATGQPIPRRSLTSAVERGPRVDLDFRNAELALVFRHLATVAGRNIVIAPGVSGTITLRLKAVPWRQALEAICAAHGLELEISGDIVLIRNR